MTRALILYHSGSALVSFAILYYLSRIKGTRSMERLILLGILQVCLLALGAILYPLDGFGRLQLLAWGIFMYFPLYLAGSLILFLKEKPGLSITAGLLLTAVLFVAGDAFLIEPHWLKITRLELRSDKLNETITVAVLADIQTDSPGAYEKRTLELAAAESPDLVLYAGDYLQVMEPGSYEEAARELNDLIRRAGLTPPLGSYAVRGNVDWNVWEEIFKGLEVTTFEKTRSLDLGPLELTGLAWLDSGNPALEVPGSNKFQIVLGHSPNYSLGDNKADLLLAGHTHGGQIQLPGIGPLLTLSAVPRSWASGLTEIQPGRYLLVSRGIGLERGQAPRMRFLCRPELVILTLVPDR